MTDDILLRLLLLVAVLVLGLYGIYRLSCFIFDITPSAGEFAKWLCLGLLLGNFLDD